MIIFENLTPEEATLVATFLNDPREDEVTIVDETSIRWNNPFKWRRNTYNYNREWTRVMGHGEAFLAGFQAAKKLQKV